MNWKAQDSSLETQSGSSLRNRRDVLKGITLAGAFGASHLASALSPANSESSHIPNAFLPSVEQWGTQEIVLTSGRKHANPFADVQLQAGFTAGGLSTTVTGFFDGNATWKVRFMPRQQGHYAFVTKSNDPMLDGQAGEFEVTAPTQDNHGPVTVANHFHFSHVDGTPYYPLGTTEYGFFQTDREVQLRTLSTLSGTSFNKIRALVMPFSSLIPGDGPFVRTDGKFDFERFDVDYFRRYEAGLRDLQAMGIEVDLILFHPYDAKGKFSGLPETVDEAYVRYTLARLSAFRNVWWTLTNEFDLYPQFGFSKNWTALGTLLATSDPYDHLRGIHNSCVGFYDNSESWITHVILQDITLQRLTAKPRNDSAMSLDARKFGKPVVVDEYGYEGNNGLTWGSIAPREAVEFHWSIVMAGAYGSHGESYFGTPRGEFVGESPSRLAFLKSVMTDTPFQKMEPLPNALATPDPAVTVLGEPGVCYVIHFDQPKEAADWNLGFFGPATPSHPLAIVKGSVDPNTWHTPGWQFKFVDGVYKVELIDTWRMKTYLVGYTSGALQQFRSPIAPGVLRLTRTESAPTGGNLLPVAELLQHFRAL